VIDAQLRRRDERCGDDAEDQKQILNEEAKKMVLVRAVCAVAMVLKQK